MQIYTFNGRLSVPFMLSGPVTLETGKGLIMFVSQWTVRFRKFRLQ